ncbi:class I SAM-dependent methyltransferase [Methylobacillus gramineus]|uniref:class I SAM-dependent methyltransferase n=1 Tax=Methylobacillus gramineus TaxID=755169 RepID=UPI001CFFE1E5|nr:class I SAM-dependent methyltransferase [Methylobacillus gramineus]MCB5183800.1 class I SAM-dependent methyltransferase [Methylobacillus gramineus]
MQSKQDSVSELSGARKRFPPAILAFFIQLVALGLTWVILQVGYMLFAVTLAGWGICLLQSVISALLATGLRMAVWWRIIHFLFPVTIFFMLQWNVPPWVYLSAFLFTLALFWSTFKTQVPFYPSLPTTWRQVKQLIPEDKPVSILDVGSGLGGLVMYLARERPNAACAGIEVAPLPWLISALLAVIKKSSARFKYGNYQAVNLSEYDVVFAYLSPAAMPELWQKAVKEMRSGSVLISYEFEIPGITPKLQIQDRPDSPCIFVWEF